MMYLYDRLDIHRLPMRNESDAILVHHPKRLENIHLAFKPCSAREDESDGS